MTSADATTQELRPDDTGFTDADRAAIAARREWIARATDKTKRRFPGKQLPPDPRLRPYDICYFRAGRGWGKSESVHQVVWYECYRVPGITAHMVAPTLGDLPKVTFEGPIGFRAIVPAELLYRQSWERAFNKQEKTLRFANGSKIIGFAGREEASRLRGPQCHVLGGDELREWDRPAGNLEAALSNALFGLRLPYPDGTPSRAYLGSTPRAIPFLKRFEKRPEVVVIRGTTYENMPNLSRNFINTVLAYEGTAIGRQEIHAEDLDTDAVGIFKPSWFPLWPADKKLPEFLFILESYDTGFDEEHYDQEQQSSDPTACIVLGIFNCKAAFTEQELKRLGVRAKYAALLCDAWSERLAFPELLERARAQHRVKWGSPGRRSDVVLIESEGAGISLRQSLMRYSVPTLPFDPRGMSKTMRAHAASPAVLQKHIFVPESGRPDRKGMVRDWVEPFLDQVCAFAGPASVEHDDWVDCLDQAVLYLMNREFFEVAPPERYVDFEHKRGEEEQDAVRRKHDSEPRTNPYY